MQQLVEHRVPLAVLTAGVVLTAGSLLLVGQLAYRTQHDLDEVVSTELRLDRLNGRIVYLDEVLTMSTNMAAATGDLDWKERYDAHVDDLDVALRDVVALAPDTLDAAAARKTEEANARLVRLEADAFAAVARGDAAEAQRVLGTIAYSSAKQEYRAGMRTLSESVGRRVDQRVAAARARVTSLSMVALSALTLVLGGWLVAAWIIRRDLAARSATRAAEERAQAAERARERQSARNDERALQYLNTELTRRLTELHRVQDALQDNARRAGMADVARSVLHNVGNTLGGMMGSFAVIDRHLRTIDADLVVRASRVASARTDSAPEREAELARLVGTQLTQTRSAVDNELATVRERLTRIEALLAAYEQFLEDVPVVQSTVTLQEMLHNVMTAVPGRGRLLDVDDQVGEVVLDRTKVQRVLAAMLAFAVRRSTGGKPIHVRMDRTGNVLAIRTTDNGPALAPTERIALFSPTDGDAELHQAACEAAEIGGRLTAHAGEVGLTLELSLPDVRSTDTPLHH